MVCFLIYVFYVLFKNTQKIMHLHAYHHLCFNLVIFSISLILSCITLLICRENTASGILPAIFATIPLLILLFIALYDKFLILLEENSCNKIQAEISRMEQNYFEQIESHLNELHSIRHDMRNHLIILDEYAAKKDYEKLHEYILKIEGFFETPPLFETPSAIVSSLLNEKYHAARCRNVDCSIFTDFPYIHMDDFSIITILGNLLDNAICAASKCQNGWITICLRQLDSYLEINVKNNHTEPIIEREGVFKTTKKNSPMPHGIGIKNVRKAVTALNGQITISYTDELFDVCILVPNY